LPVAQTSHSTVAYNGYLYIVGGNTGPSCTTTVRMAPINGNGTIGSWSTTSSLPAARCGNVEAVTVANGFMYAAGGFDNGNVTSAVYYAQINANGTLGAWQTNANSLTIAREYNGLETINGYLYAIGGQAATAGSGSASVQVGALNANGSVGPFTSTTSLPGPRGELATEAIAGRLYAIGGGTGGSGANPQDSVWFTGAAPADPNPPTVSLTAPAPGSTVSGTINVTANAADDTGVLGVQFLLDGQPLGLEDTTAPYSLSWDSTGASNGAHTLSARARDIGNNQTTSANVPVTVANVAPTLPPLRVGHGFEEGSGSTTVDVSPNGNNGALTSTSWTTSGRYGNALTYNGNSSRVRSSADVALGTSFTLEAWMLNPGNQAYETLMTVGSNRDLYLVNGVPTFWTGANDYSFGVALPTGSWQHVALTYDGTTLRLYVNGALYGAPQTANIAATSAPLQVGAWIGPGSNNADFFSGTIDDVRVYAGALSAAAIQADAATPVSPPVDNTAPVLSGGAPIGAQPAGTTQVNLQVTTDENATCRTGTVAGTAYGALPLTFTTTGGTAHSRTITGLTNGTSYTYYVRCQDGAGNATTADYPISFSVSTPDGVPPTVSVTAPAGGSTVSATVPVTANANDNVGVVGVQFLLDGAALGSEDTSAPYSVSWNTTTASNDNHVLTARARDLAGNQTTSSAVNVTVSNTAPPASGPLLAYGLNSSGGTAVADSSGNNRNATLTAGTWTTGRYGNAVAFDGDNTRVRSDANVALTGPFTMEAWVLNPGTAPYETVVTIGANRDLYLAGGIPRFDSGPTFLSFGAALPTNVWQHLAITYDGTTMRAYVDGALYGTPQAISLGAVNAPVQIGAWIFGGGNADYLSGTIDEVRVYDRALSQAEVAADAATPIT
jgi:Concanavalin A-like lectin/glucanases superfamily/Bacterial Ig domain